MVEDGRSIDEQRALYSTQGIIATSPTKALAQDPYPVFSAILTVPGPRKFLKQLHSWLCLVFFGYCFFLLLGSR